MAKQKLEYGTSIDCPVCKKPGTVQDVEDDFYNVIHDRKWTQVKSASTGNLIDCETSRVCRVERKRK